MKLVRNGEVPPVLGATFTGKASVTLAVPAQEPGGVTAALVRFEDGALTHWHTHPGEQILFVVDGHGRVGDETGQWEIGPGDVVRIGPGERHWHGAARGASMTHLSVTTVGPPDWQEPVAEAVVEGEG